MLPTHSLAAAVSLASASSPQPAAPAEGQKPTKRQQSEVGSPVALTWAIAHSMRLQRADVPRKAILAELDRAGVAYYTARTQLQAYLKEMKRLAELAALAK